jgi:hypothetical protein
MLLLRFQTAIMSYVALKRIILLNLSDRDFHRLPRHAKLDKTAQFTLWKILC